MTIEEIFKDHLYLKKEDILAAQEFETEYLAKKDMASQIPREKVKLLSKNRSS